MVPDEATDPWGIKINRVEVKNIVPPRDIQTAMEKQMRAERERREAILRAEGEKKSAILIAEGKKEAVILEAEAAKEAAIRSAEGQSTAIRMVQQANADSIRMIVEAGPTKEIIAIKSLESFAKAADGQSTKIIIPSEIAGLAGLATTLKEFMKEDGENN
ncbi:MAG TPA: SPFH domain-containing protein, partial [Bacillota bacterium]|nr:SPFH domain-containing protein [Bacillota bacterium]